MKIGCFGLSTYKNYVFFLLNELLHGVNELLMNTQSQNQMKSKGFPTIAAFFLATWTILRSSIGMI